jgi:uncharacterized RDD family membrane protein YckC
MPPGMPPQGGAPYGAVGEYAPWGSRAIGFLARVLIFVPVYIVVFILTAISDVLGLLALLVFWVFAVGAAIRMYIQRGHLGYDFGDRVAGQRLLKESTGTVMGSGMNVFVRQLAHIVDSLICYVGWLFPLWDAKRQTLGDKIMGTIVVKDPAQAHSAQALLINALQLWTPVTKS